MIAHVYTYCTVSDIVPTQPIWCSVRYFFTFFFILLAPHKFEVQSLTMNKEGALIGRSPSISRAVVTIATGFVRVMHVHRGRL